MAVIGGYGPSSSGRTVFNVPAIQAPPTPLTGLRQQQQPATGVFTPADLFASGQKGVFYDYTDIASQFQDTAGTTVVTASGQAAARINDQSGNGNHLLQATSGKRATYQSSGGLSSLRFDGTDDCYQTSGALDLSAYGQLGVLIAFKPTGSSTMVLAELGPNVNSTADTFYVAAVNDPATGQISTAVSDNSGAADGVATTSTSYGSGVTSVISYQSLDVTNASAATRLPMRRNSASEPVTVTNDVGGAGTAFASTQPLNVGSRNGASFFFAGDLYALIIRGGGFTSTELNNVEAWATAKTVASSATYNDSLTETAGAADGVDPAGSTFGVPLTETAGTNVGLATSQAFVNGLTETAAAADSLSAGLVIGTSLNEAVAPADALSSAMTFVSAITETAATNDSLASQATFGGSVTESAAAAVTPSSSAIFADAISEGAAANDALLSQQTLNNALGESATPSVTQSIDGATYNEAVSETLATDVSFGVGLVIGAALAETAGATASVVGEVTTAAAGNIKLFDGSTFIAKPVKVWTASGWAQKPLKRWDGAAWTATA